MTGYSHEMGRNPFLSRAGFDTLVVVVKAGRLSVSQSLFK